MIVLLDVNFLLDTLQLGDSDIARLFKSVCNLEWVDALVKQLLGLLEDSACKHHHTGGTVADFVVLGGRQLDQ